MITNDKYVVHTTFSINMITIDTGNHVLMAAKVELGGGYLGTPKFWVFYRNENLKKNGNFAKKSFLVFTWVPPSKICFRPLCYSLL